MKKSVCKWQEVHEWNMAATTNCHVGINPRIDFTVGLHVSSSANIIFEVGEGYNLIKTIYFWKLLSSSITDIV